jgi:hypothetical protein
VQQGARAVDIAIGQVLEAHGHLYQALKRLAVAALGAQPVGLEELVHLEVEVRVEEQRR